MFSLLTLILTGIFIYRAYDYYHIRTYEPVKIEADADDTTTNGPAIISDGELPPYLKEEPKPYTENKVGWLQIPGIPIDDPIVQYTDNDKYLRLNEYDEKSVWGAYFVNAENNISDVYNLDRVTTIFGHSNGQATSPKFANLKLLKNPKTAATTRTIKLWIGETKTTWRIFAVGDYPVENNYLITNPADEFYIWEIEEMKKSSYNAYEVDVSTADKILILSTCTSGTEFDTRFIVCAKLTSIG